MGLVYEDDSSKDILEWMQLLYTLNCVINTGIV